MEKRQKKDVTLLYHEIETLRETLHKQSNIRSKRALEISVQLDKLISEAMEIGRP